MAFSPHTLIEFGGTLAGGSTADEIWTCGVRAVSFNTGGPFPDADIEAWLDGFVDGDWTTPQTIKDWFSKVGSEMSSSAQLTWVKCNNIGADGKYSNAGITHVRDFAGVAGAGTPRAPGFCTLAYTWETLFTRGPGHRGRIYPPNFAWAYTGSVVSNTDRDSNAAAGADLIDTIWKTNFDAGASDSMRPVVASRVNGAIRDIVSVTSDNVYDVQRRRKNQINGSRSAPVPVSRS